MGLLKLAEQFQEENNKPNQPTARDLLAEVHHSSRKIDFPYTVFKLFKTLINFEWGILLLPNEIERRYFVWASTGHSPDEVQNFVLSFDQPEIVAPTEMIIPFVPGHTNEIPHEIIHGGNLIVLGDLETPTACIYCQSPAIPTAKKEIKNLNHHLGREIAESRKSIDYELENLAPSNWLGKVRNEKITILVINIEKAAEHLLEAIPGMHKKVARNEVTGIIRHFKGRIGYLYDLKDGRLLLLAPRKRLPDHELYLHQINLSYASALHLPKDNFCLQGHAVQWPEEKDKMIKNFPGLFS